MSQHDLNAWADRFFGAIERADVPEVSALYSEDIAVWHNTDGLVEDKQTNLGTLRRLSSSLSDVRYLDQRREFFADGFVQQHTLTGVGVDGTRVALAAVVVVHLEQGLCVRIDEYFDSAHAAEFHRLYQLAGATG